MPLPAPLNEALIVDQGEYGRLDQGQYIIWNICDWILETDQIVTLGLFHYIGPANSYTHTLPIHSGITRLS